jgi:hypothetical protein
MYIKKRIFALFTSLNYIIVSVYGQEIPVSEEEKEDTSIHNYPVAAEISGGNLEEKKNVYLEKKGLDIGFDADGTYIGWSTADINTSPSSIDFAQKRIAAFERAFSDAKAKYVRTKKQQSTNSIARKFFSDDRPAEMLEDDSKTDGALKRIGKKLEAVTEAKLDQVLEGLGRDPNEISDLNIKQKRTLAEDSINKETLNRAVQSLSGVIILTTFEDTNSVGVLIKHKSRYSDLARAIASRTLVGYPSPTDPVQAIAAQLDSKFSELEHYIPTHGMRFVVDESGNRGLISYGQWAPKVTRTDSKMKQNMAIKAAREIAYNQSLSYMVQFLNTTIAVEDVTKINDNNQINSIIENDFSTEQEISAVGASIDQFIKESSSATIEGATTVKRWSANHPDTGHLIVGNVLYWSPITQEAVRQKPKTEAITNTKSSVAKPVENKVYQGIEFGDEDF